MEDKWDEVEQMLDESDNRSVTSSQNDAKNNQNKTL